jgi:hypothetical protein
MTGGTGANVGSFRLLRQLLTIGRAYDLRHSFASLLIHEGRSLTEVAVQLGDAVATVAGTYAHAFAEAEALVREPAADAIEAARTATGVRQMYVDLATFDAIDGAEAASTKRADARIRTADPFITSSRVRSRSWLEHSLPGARSSARVHHCARKCTTVHHQVFCAGARARGRWRNRGSVGLPGRPD